MHFASDQIVGQPELVEGDRRHCAAAWLDAGEVAFKQHNRHARPRQRFRRRRPTYRCADDQNLIHPALPTP
jgi:hypothetical protein